MGVTTLNANEALNPGADLWIVAHPESSRWALKIDWELGFQILRSSQHQKPVLAPELTKLVQQAGLPTLQLTTHTQPLMVAADMNLPCRWVLSLSPFQWSQALEAWEKLNRPSVRIFLPQTQSADQIAKETKSIGDFQVVLD